MDWGTAARPISRPPDILPPFQNEISHDEHCAVCKRGADLQPCGTCSGSYHLSCLEPPIKATPKGVWMCPRCQQKVGRDFPCLPPAPDFTAV